MRTDARAAAGTSKAKVRRHPDVTLGTRGGLWRVDMVSALLLSSDQSAGCVKRRSNKEPLSRANHQKHHSKCFRVLYVRIPVINSSPNFRTKKKMNSPTELASVTQSVSPLIWATWKLRAELVLIYKLFICDSDI